jgi:hypothetical protein
MQLYKVTGFIPDMGSYTTTARATGAMESAIENALWDFNSARDHDGLPHLTLDEFNSHIQGGNVKFTPIHP